MNLSLYTIQQEYLHIAEALLDNGGELTPELSEALTINQQNLETKSTNYGLVIKELESQIDIIDSEIKRLSALKASRNKTIDRLKENISTAMKIYNVEEIATPLLKINFRKSESVEVPVEAMLDKEYIVTKTTTSVDKVKIKEAIKRGETVFGAVLKENKNLQIK